MFALGRPRLAYSPSVAESGDAQSGSSTVPGPSKGDSGAGGDDTGSPSVDPARANRGVVHDEMGVDAATIPSTTTSELRTGETNIGKRAIRTTSIDGLNGCEAR